MELIQGAPTSLSGGEVKVNPDGSVSVTAAPGTGIVMTGGHSPFPSIPAVKIVQASPGVISGLDVYGNGTGRMVGFFTATAPSGWNPQCIIGTAGQIMTNAWITINGHPADSLGNYIPPPVADPYMLGVGGDINGPAIVCRSGFGSNAYNYANVDPNGNYTLSIEYSGKLQWGASTHAAMDTNLYRNSAGQLKTDGQFQAAQGIATIAVTGPVSDASFSSPPVGSLVVDTTGNLWAKTATATWKKAPLA